MAQSENTNSKEKKEWVTPEFLTEDINKTESGPVTGSTFENSWYSS